MNLQGDFEGLTLSSILQLLNSDQKTGVLTVTCENAESRVFFEQGTIVYASASLKELKLGFLMQTGGAISAHQLQECLAHARQEKMHLGMVLIEKKYVSLETLKKFNTRQVEAILYNLLFWKKGRFEYKDVKLNLKGMIITQLNPMKLVLEASRRVDELSVLKEIIQSDAIVFKMTRKVHSREEIKLNANEWRILSLIDGRKSVRQIIKECGNDEFSVYKVFSSVLSSGLIEQDQDAAVFDPDRESEYASILDVFNDILAAIKTNIADDLGDRSYSLFEEIKSGLAIEFKDVLVAYHPDNHKNSNLEAITRALDKIDEMNDPKDFLIRGFIEYCDHALRKVEEILGSQALIKILDDIEKLLGYVKKYQTGSKEKNKIVDDMKTIIEKNHNKFKADKRRGSKRGIFSLFS